MKKIPSAQAPKSGPRPRPANPGKLGRRAKVREVVIDPASKQLVSKTKG